MKNSSPVIFLTKNFTVNFASHTKFYTNYAKTHEENVNNNTQKIKKMRNYFI